MKKMLWFMFTFGLFGLIACAPALAASSGTCGSGLTWSLSNSGTLTISGTGAMTDYYSATSSPFYNNQDILQVIIQDGVSSIGDYAFHSCNALESISIPDSVSSIGKDSFRGCSALTGIHVPEGVQSIRPETFYGCTSLTEVVLPSTITVIGYDAFNYCESLQTISIPSQVATLGSFAFGNCTALRSITLPQGVETIPYSCFIYCRNLTQVNLPSSLTTIGERAFLCCSKFTSFVIPNHVTTIDKSAFWACSALTSMKIPDSVTTIGSGAFERCTALTSLTIPETVTEIGKDAMLDCPNLTVYCYENTRASYYCGQNSITYEIILKKCGDDLNWSLRNGVLSIYGMGPMYDYTVNNPSPFRDRANTITRIEIGEDVTSIGKQAFWGCGATEVRFSSDGCLHVIGDQAFYKCASLSSLNLPDTLTTLGQRAFSSCTSLETITLPDSLPSMGIYTFEGCTSLQNVTLSGGMTTVPQGAFDYCTSLASVDLRNIKTVGNYAFQDCSSLQEIEFASGATHILAYAFQRCSGLAKAVLPATISNIGSDAFAECPNLTIFGANGSYASVYAANNSIPFVSITLMEPDFYLPAGLKRLEEDALFGVNATVIYLPDGVTYIGTHALAGCQHLKQVRIPASVTSVGEEIFNGCPINVVLFGSSEFARQLANTYGLIYVEE